MCNIWLPLPCNLLPAQEQIVAVPFWGPVPQAVAAPVPASRPPLWRLPCAPQLGPGPTQLPTCAG